MTDNADIVRAGIRIHPDEPTDVMVDLELRAFAALVALVVERPEARAAYQREVEAFRALGGSNLMQAIARAEAAEAENVRLREALDSAMLYANHMNHCWINHEVNVCTCGLTDLRAALVPTEEEA